MMKVDANKYKEKVVKQCGLFPPNLKKMFQDLTQKLNCLYAVNFIEIIIKKKRKNQIIFALIIFRTNCN